MSKSSLNERLKQRKLMIAGFMPEEIVFYDLMHKTEAEISTYLPTSFSWRIQRPAMNAEMTDLIKDKWTSQLFLEAVGVRMPKLYGVWDPQVGILPGGAPLRTVEQFRALIEPEIPSDAPLDLFFKTRSGGRGQNAFRVKMTRGANEIEATKSDGTTQSLEALLSTLPTDSQSLFEAAGKGWLIQERVPQHASVAELNPSSLNTARIGTYWELPVNGQHSAPKLDFAYQRVGRTGLDIEGMGISGIAGGISVEVDVKTGRMGRGRYSWREQAAFVDKHPDSGFELNGRELPFWKEVEELCCRAALCFPTIRSIGWDIAFAEDGPLIVEANDGWNLTPLQGYGPYLTPQRRAVFEREGMPLPPRDLPSNRAVLAYWLKYRLQNLMPGR